MKNRKSYSIRKQDYLVLLAWCILIAFAILVSSCTTERKVKRWMDNNGIKMSEWCSQKYPVKTEYLKGETIVKNDTTLIKGDSIPCPETIKGKIVKVKCPDVATVYTTINRVDTVIKENTAKVAYYKGLYDLETIEKIKTDEILIESNKTAKKRLNWIVFLSGTLTIGVLMKFSKLIFPFL